MKKSLTLTLLAMLLVGLSAFSQLCTYSISGQALGSNGAVANGQLIVINTVNGIDSVYSNPNGFYSYSIQATCTTSITFTINPPGCIGGAISVDVSPNQPMALTFEGCPGSSPTSPSCTTTANVSTLGNTIQYSQTASSNSGVITSVLWNMGDGYTTNNYPNGGSYTYAAPGVYQACVTVTWSNGCVATDCETVVIGTIPNTCIYTFNGYVTDSILNAMDNIPVTVSIPQQNGVAGATYSTVTNANGYYSIDVVYPCNTAFATLVYATAAACNSQTGLQVNATPNSITYSQNIVVCSGVVNNPCYGTITADIAENGEMGYHWFSSPQPDSIFWNFGDGSSAVGMNNNSHVYASPGTYIVCATATWNIGCTATACDTVTLTITPNDNINGWVAYEDNGSLENVDCGTVYLIDISNNTAFIVDSVDLAINGFYFFGTYPSTYTLWAVPCDWVGTPNEFLPTYYGNSIFWTNADTAEQGVGSSNGIILVNAANVQGPAQIGGTIYWGEDKDPGDPVVGANVFLLNVNGEPVGMATTDIEGYYSFVNLAYGTYQIFPEKLAYDTHPLYVTLSATAPNVEASNFYLGFGLFSPAGMEESVVAITSLYPNPAQDEALISFTSKFSGSGKISITDITGKNVLTTNTNINKGAQSIQLNVQSLASGLYTVTLTLDKQQYQAKLIKK